VFFGGSSKIFNKAFWASKVRRWASSIIPIFFWGDVKLKKLIRFLISLILIEFSKFINDKSEFFWETNLFLEITKISWGKVKLFARSIAKVSFPIPSFPEKR